MKKLIQKIKRGSILIETLLALVLGSSLITIVAQSLMGSQQSNLSSFQKQQAEFYAKEAKSAVKSLWLDSWQNISNNGTYHPIISSGDWFLNTGEETIGIFKRKIEISDILRDSNGLVVSEGGVLDPSTKKITITISWDSPIPRSVVRESLLTRYYQNTSWTEDSLEDYIDGVEDATDVTTNPGFVQLAQTGGGEWEEPGSIHTVDCSAKVSGGWVTQSRLYITLDKLEGGVEVFDLEDPGPASPSSLGIFDTEATGLDIAINGSYAYITHGSRSPSVSVYDLSADPVNPNFIGWANIPQNSEGIWITPDYIFLTVLNDSKVAVYQKNADPLNPTFLGTFDTLTTTADIAVSGSYIYVALKSTTNSVQVFNIISEPENPESIGSFANLYEPTGIWVEGNTLYLSLDQKRAAMYTLEYNPVVPRILGIFQIERNTSDVAAYGDYGYVFGTDSQLKAIEVIYVADSKGISGIYFVYGEYISSTLELPNQSAFNFLTWDGDKPNNTNILFQIALNDDNATWNFIGPDGTAVTYFEEPSAIPLTNILGTYFKYKIILTGDSGISPTVDKVIVNYSP